MSTFSLARAQFARFTTEHQVVKPPTKAETSAQATPPEPPAPTEVQYDYIDQLNKLMW
jgi:hypothetical protein